MKQATIDSFRNFVERVGAFTAVVTDAFEGSPHQATVASLSSEVIARADDVSDEILNEEVD